MMFPFRIGIDGEDAQSKRSRQENKRHDFRPLSGNFVLRAEGAAYGSGVGFKFLPKQFGEMRPDGPISKSPAAELHPERDEILEAPLIRKPSPDCGLPFYRFGHPLEDRRPGALAGDGR